MNTTTNTTARTRHYLVLLATRMVRAQSFEVEARNKEAAKQAAKEQFKAEFGSGERFIQVEVIAL